jgi:vitamin B12 transporter
MNLRLPRPGALVGALLAVAWGNAAAAPDKTNDPKNPLAEVIVTAARAPESKDETAASVSVITRTDIERSQAQSTTELLSRVAGVSITNNGGLGKASSLLIRGAEADQNLILIDGVRVGSTTLGTASLQDVPLDQIERIEIVRGPRSALYGADALGGVVQLFTRGAARNRQWQSELTASTGSNDTRRAALSLGRGSERGFFRAGASYLESDGTNSCAGFGAPIFAGCFTDEPDRDGYRNTSASMRAGVSVGSSTELEAFALYATGRTEYDGSFGNVADFSQLTYGVSVAHEFSDRWSVRTQLGRAADDTENFAGSDAVGTFDTRRDSASVIFDGTFAKLFTLTSGFDFVDDSVASDTAYAETSRSTVGVFTQLRAKPGRHEWLVSARLDDNEQFGSEVTGSVGWSFAVGGGWRLTASAGTAFKAPTFNELYFPDFGNPNLQPETSRSFETSARYSSAGLQVSATAFENRIEDLIGFDTNFAPVNIDESRIRGIELEGATRIGRLDVNALAEWNDPQNRSAANSGKLLPRRPRERARLEIGAPLGPVRIGAVALYSGERFDNLSNSRRLGSYAVFDLLGEWRVRPNVTLQARVANALDRDYATAAFYPQPGREIYVTARFNP